jgi:hypothetical protein
MRFEFSFDEERWYNLWGSRIETKNWNDLLNRIRQMTINQKDIEIDGEYTQDEPRKLIIY